jgi:hypothetical protein
MEKKRLTPVAHVNYTWFSVPISQDVRWVLRLRCSVTPVCKECSYYSAFCIYLLMVLKIPYSKLTVRNSKYHEVELSGIRYD